MALYVVRNHGERSHVLKACVVYHRDDATDEEVIAVARKDRDCPKKARLTVAQKIVLPRVLNWLPYGQTAL